MSTKCLLVYHNISEMMSRQNILPHDPFTTELNQMLIGLIIPIPNTNCIMSTVAMKSQTKMQTAIITITKNVFGVLFLHVTCAKNSI